MGSIQDGDIDGLFDITGLTAGKKIPIIGWVWADIYDIEFNPDNENKVKGRTSRGTYDFDVPPVKLKEACGD